MELEKSRFTKNNNIIKNNIQSIILRALFEGDKYGLEIAKEVEGKTDGECELKQPTLYNVLKRLESQNLILSYWGEESHGGRRRYYRLTISGLELCQKQQTDWEYSRSLLDKLVSDKQFDGSQTRHDIDIQIDMKQRRNLAKKTKSDRLDRVFNSKPVRIADVDKAAKNEAVKFEFKTDAYSGATDTDAALSAAHIVTTTVMTETIDIETKKTYIDAQKSDADTVVNDTETTGYYRLLEENLELLMEDGKNIDSAIDKTNLLLGSLAEKNTESEVEAVQNEYVSTDIRSVDRLDYLFKAGAITPPSLPDEDASQKSYLENQKNISEEAFRLLYSYEPKSEEAAVAHDEIDLSATESFIFETTESDAEKEYKKIISNLLYKKSQDSVVEEIKEIKEEICKPDTTLAKITASIKNAPDDFNFETIENQSTVSAASADISDLKEKLSLEGIKIRQYNKDSKTSSERYQFYYINKLLFAAFWLTYACAILELGLIYLIFNNSVDFSAMPFVICLISLLLFPIYGTINNYNNLRKKVRANWDFKYALINALIIFGNVFILILSINLVIFNIALSNINEVVLQLVLPTVMAFNICVFMLIYNGLYKSKKYFVN
jgi:PadR family transcriptional regulator PadR